MKGTTLGPCRIDAELGAGGMGRVYRATTFRKVAGLDPGATRSLICVNREIAAAAKAAGLSRFPRRDRRAGAGR